MDARKARLIELCQQNDNLIFPFCHAPIADLPDASDNAKQEDQTDTDSEKLSSNDEDLDDTDTANTVWFNEVGERVAVAFAGGVWYPGIVKDIVSPAKALINYLHPSSHRVPLPDKTDFIFPKKKDELITDAGSVCTQHETSTKTERQHAAFCLFKVRC